MTEQPMPPAWVRKRDGSVVPFDADKISQALFAATEALGRPDAFLARELTDGALHFLAVENDDDTLTTSQIAEIVGKTVRELGQPALAEAFAARVPSTPDASSETILLRAPRDVPPRLLVPQLLHEYTRQAVYSSQLLAAQSDGLLTITGFEASGELAMCAVAPFDPPEEVRRWVWGTVVFDGPEYALARGGKGTADIDHFVRDTLPAARLLGLRSVVNLNCATPPPFAGDLARGPLFAEQPGTADEARLSSIGDRLLEHLMQPSFAAEVYVNWHLAERDFVGDRLRHVAQAVADGGAITFVFDRPRRPLLLAEGIDRQHPAALLTVGLHLPRLAAQPGLAGDVPLFLQKLGSLARLAISAGVQKREYLRRLERTYLSPLTTGFLLDRAGLVVVPVGLDHVVQQLVGRGLTSGGAALDLGKQIVARLRDVLKQEGRATHLDVCVDGVSTFSLGGGNDAEGAAGLTAWNPTAAVKGQLRAAGVLHAVAERGCAALFLNGDELTPEGVTDCLRQAWEAGDVASLRVRPNTDSRPRRPHET
jgi:hypothetical protein